MTEAERLAAARVSLTGAAAAGAAWGALPLAGGIVCGVEKEKRKKEEKKGLVS